MVLPMCLSIFRATGKVSKPESRGFEAARSCGKTSVRLVNRGHVTSVKRMIVGNVLDYSFINKGFK